MAMFRPASASQSTNTRSVCYDQVALSPLNGSVVVVPAGVDGLEQVFEPRRRRRRCQICSPPPTNQPTHSWERRTIAPLPSDNVDTLSDVFRRPIQSEFCCWCRVQRQNTTYVFATSRSFGAKTRNRLPTGYPWCETQSGILFAEPQE